MSEPQSQSQPDSQLVQILLSFAGRAEKSSDAEMRAAAAQLKANLKQMTKERRE